MSISQSISLGSYNAQCENRNFTAELERLQEQVLISWPQESRLLNWLGLHDGLSVIELGSGPGFFSQQLLTLLPNSSITALEPDTELHLIAQQQFNSATPLLHCIQASLPNTGLPENYYDFAIARLLFQHLSDPVAAAQEIYRILAPGGCLAVIDIDAALWGIVEPYIPELQTIYQKSVSFQAQCGGNRLIGRRLWKILELAGYSNLQLETFTYHSDALGIQSFSKQISPDRLLPAVQAGFISLEEFVIAQKAYQTFLEAENSYILMVGFMAYGEKWP